MRWAFLIIVIDCCNHCRLCCQRVVLHCCGSWLLSNETVNSADSRWRRESNTSALCEGSTGVSIGRNKLRFLNVERSCVSNAWLSYSRSPCDEAELAPSAVSGCSVVDDTCEGSDFGLVIGRVSWVGIDTVCGLFGVVSCFPSDEISLTCIEVSSNIVESLFVSLDACEDHRIEDWSCAASSTSWR